MSQRSPAEDVIHSSDESRVVGMKSEEEERFMAMHSRKKDVKGEMRAIDKDVGMHTILFVELIGSRSAVAAAVSQCG